MLFRASEAVFTFPRRLMKLIFMYESASCIQLFIQVSLVSALSWSEDNEIHSKAPPHMHVRAIYISRVMSLHRQ